MSYMVSDFLDYAQIKAGKFRINNKLFNIIEAIEEVMCVQRKKAYDCRISFFSTFVNIASGESDDDSSKFSSMIYSDKQRIQQVLLNLQSNALKFTAEGSVEIKVQIIKSLIEEDFLVIDIIDTGIGIEDEDQSKLFKLFGFV